jgi:hypothetical protein
VSLSASWAALAVLLPALLVELLIVLPQRELWVLLLAVAWISIAGVSFAGCALGRTSAAWRSAALIGPALGFGFGVFGLMLFWAAGVQSAWVLALAPIFTLVLAGIAWRTGVSIRLPEPRSPTSPAFVALLVVPIVTFAPYAHVAEAAGRAGVRFISPPTSSGR